MTITRRNFSRRIVAVLAVCAVSLLFCHSRAWALDKDARERKTPTVQDLLNKGATYTGSADCATCHEQQEKEYKLSTHARISVKDAEVKDCEMCHGPGSLHVEAGGGRGVEIINPKKDPSTCFSCHLDKKLEFRLPYHHPVLEGKMGCADCHEAHGAEIKPWSATTMEGVNEACFKCHKDKRGPFVWAHEAVREGCQSCHKVHGSIHDKLLIARDKNLCLRCHLQIDAGGIGKEDHSLDSTGQWRRGTCWSAGCHTGIHGSNFDDHLFAT